MSDPIIDAAVADRLSLEVLKSGRWSYRVIFSDTRKLLQRCWPEILVTVLFAPPILWMINRWVVGGVFGDADYQNKLILAAALIVRRCLESLWFVALAPALVIVQSRIAGLPLAFFDVLERSRKFAVRLFLAGIIYKIVCDSGTIITVLVPPILDSLWSLENTIRESLHLGMGFPELGFYLSIVLPMIFGFILASYLFFFGVGIVFRKLGTVESLLFSVRLVCGNWWKLSFLFLLMEPDFLFFQLIELLLPDFLLGIPWIVVVEAPLRILAIGLTIVVFLNLVSVVKHSNSV